MRRIFAVVIIGMVLAGGMAGALHYQGGGYDLWLIPNSGSSVDLNPDGPIHLQDIKGYPHGMFFGDSLLTGLGTITGTFEPEPVIVLDEGPVKLNIVREGSDIKVTWQINTEEYSIPDDNPVDVYVKMGAGTGVFDSTSGYVKIIENNAQYSTLPTDLQGTLSINEGDQWFKLTGQVGGGNAELYFKGLLTGSDPMATTDYGLGAAVAVGKFDTQLLPVASGSAYKYSFISIPFVVTDTSPDAVFGNQMPAGTNASNSTQLWGWTGTTFGEQMYLHSSTGWQTISGYSPITIYPGAGFVFYRVAGADEKIVTLVGKVMNIPFGPMAMRGNLYTFFSNPYPKAISLLNANFTAAAGVHGATTAGYADQMWGWTGITFGDQSYYNSTGDDWQSISGYTLLDTLKPGRTFVYYKGSSAPTTGFDWGFGP